MSEKSKNKEFYKFLGETIRSLRDKEKMSQEELAKKIGAARESCSNWETGKSSPSIDQLMEIARLFKVPLDRIVDQRINNSLIIVDSSALLSSPSVVDALFSFDEVVITDATWRALENPPNGCPKCSASSVIEKIKSTTNTKLYRMSINEGENERDAIIRIAADNVKDYHVSVLSNDPILGLELPTQLKNLTFLTSEVFFKKYAQAKKNCDFSTSMQFINLVQQGKYEDLRSFDVSEIDINEPQPETGLPPLIIAVKNQDTRILQYLLEAPHVNVDIIDKSISGFSAVHYAAKLNNPEIIEMLVDYGANVDLPSRGKNKGNTPLMIAAWNGFSEIVDYLLGHGACADQQDGNGFTPLIKACINHHVDVIKKLITKSNSNIHSFENKKAIEYVNRWNEHSREICALFKEDKND